MIHPPAEGRLPARFRRHRLAGLLGALLAAVIAGAGCDNPDVVPPGPVEVPPAEILLPAGAVPPPAQVGGTATAPLPFDHRLLWHYARLMDPEVVVSFAGESDLLRELSLLEPANPQRLALLDLLYANWDATPRPAPHVRIALVRLTAAFAPADPRTTLILLTALEDSTMKVRFRANNCLKDLYAIDVGYDPNGADGASRVAAIGRWKKEIKSARDKAAAANPAPSPPPDLVPPAADPPQP